MYLNFMHTSTLYNLYTYIQVWCILDKDAILVIQHSSRLLYLLNVCITPTINQHWFHRIYTMPYLSTYSLYEYISPDRWSEYAIWICYLNKPSVYIIWAQISIPIWMCNPDPMIRFYYVDVIWMSWVLWVCMAL